MGYKSIISFSIFTLLVAFVLDTLIRFQHFDNIYDHFPGECTKYELNGSEDLALFPNDHVLISSGLNLWGNTPPPSGIFMVDLRDQTPQPIKLTIEGHFLSKISPVFNPHGLGHWVTQDGDLLLYVVNHRLNDVDTIESFQYLPETKSLKYRKTLSCTDCYDFNDVVVVEKDKMYVTRDHYYVNDRVKYWETFLRFSFGSILYLDGSGETTQAKLAADGFWYPNGIAVSNNGRFVFVNECGHGTVTALTRNDDNTLQRAQTLTLQTAPDNVFVSPDNGHLWVGIIARPFAFDKYKDHVDPSSIPVPGRILHVAIDQNAERPFDDYKVEEVFSTTGEKIGSTSGVVYHKHILLVGTIRTGMMVCNAPYLIYE